jgi:hypothetical protein
MKQTKQNGPSGEFRLLHPPNTLDPAERFKERRVQKPNPAGNPGISGIDTHWSRILYCDLFTAGPGDSTPEPCKETPMEDKNRDYIFRHVRSPISAAAVLLGLYVATYLTVAAVVHALSSLDAAAAVASEYSMPSNEASASSVPAVDVADSRPLKEQSCVFRPT